MSVAQVLVDAPIGLSGGPHAVRGPGASQRECGPRFAWLGPRPGRQAQLPMAGHTQTVTATLTSASHDVDASVPAGTRFKS